MPTVSVLIPVYKTREEYLRLAIESVLNQTYQDFELIIVDDCPKDSREKLVRSFRDKRILYYKNKKNMGITPTRNRLLGLAKGEYIAIMDHDDIALPQRFEKQVHYLNAHPDVGVVGSWYQTFPQKKLVKYPVDDAKIRLQMMKSCPICHPASMVRRSVLETYKIIYEASYSPAEDYRLWLQLLKHTKFHNIPQVLFHYRLHGKQTSQTQKNKMDSANAQLLRWAREQYPDLYQRYLSEVAGNIYIKLFNVIPLFKIKLSATIIKCYLFNFILMITIRRKNRVEE